MRPEHIDAIIAALRIRCDAAIGSFTVQSCDNLQGNGDVLRQWVIDDNFCTGCPAWEKVGAAFTDDVHAFETMKIRILNAGHQVIANVADVLSVETILGCMEHPLIGALFEKVALTEIVPHVAAVPGMTPEAYVALVKTRFSNPKSTTRPVGWPMSVVRVIPDLFYRLSAMPSKGHAAGRFALGRSSMGASVRGHTPRRHSY